MINYHEGLKLFAAILTEDGDIEFDHVRVRRVGEKTIVFDKAISPLGGMQMLSRDNPMLNRLGCTQMSAAKNLCPELARERELALNDALKLTQSLNTLHTIVRRMVLEGSTPGGKSEPQ